MTRLRESLHAELLHENTVSKILKGENRVPLEIADRFAGVFNMKLSFFINLQSHYDQALPRQIAIEKLEILRKIPC